MIAMRIGRTISKPIDNGESTRRLRLCGRFMCMRPARTPLFVQVVEHQGEMVSAFPSQGFEGRTCSRLNN